MQMVASDTAEEILNALKEVGRSRLHLTSPPALVVSAEAGPSYRPFVAGLMDQVWRSGKEDVPCLTHVESALKHLGREAMHTASSLLG